MPRRTSFRRSSWPTVPLKRDTLPLFRHATGMCLKPIGQRAVAGENRSGEPGYAHIIDCATGAEGPGMSVEVGWSKNPNAKVNWPGGLVSGMIAPDRRMGMRLVAASAPPGLEPSAPPSLGASRTTTAFTRFSGSPSRPSRWSFTDWRCASAGREEAKP